MVRRSSPPRNETADHVGKCDPRGQRCYEERLTKGAADVFAQKREREGRGRSSQSEQDERPASRDRGRAAAAPASAMDARPEAAISHRPFLTCRLRNGTFQARPLNGAAQNGKDERKALTPGYLRAKPTPTPARSTCGPPVKWGQAVETRQAASSRLAL